LVKLTASDVKLVNPNLINSSSCVFTRSNKIISKKSGGKLKNNEVGLVDSKTILNEAEDYWCKGHISNFEYLMILNTLAGRGYNDISQYFVIPWIIKDYKSDGINLNDKNIYRELNRPIHAIEDDSKQKLIAKFNEAEGEDKFHSGSLYSNPPFVSYFLIRLKPYSYISVDIQVCYYYIIIFREDTLTVQIEYSTI